LSEVEHRDGDARHQKTDDECHDTGAQSGERLATSGTLESDRRERAIFPGEDDRKQDADQEPHRRRVHQQCGRGRRGEARCEVELSDDATAEERDTQADDECER
jgi:hypothetical protein